MSLITQLQQLSTSYVQKMLNDVISSIEAENFFPIAYYKDQERIRKREFFSAHGFSRIIVITNPSNYGNVSEVIKGEVIETIADGDLLTLSSNMLECRKRLEGAIVIMTNNNVAKINATSLATLIEATPNTIYVIHDFDNHHWHDHSIKCALLADVYAPAHLSDLALVSRINPVVVACIPGGTIQWGKTFLFKHFPEMLKNKRLSIPLGMHSYYEKFRFRNSVLATVNKHFESVGWLKKDFHGRSDLERWAEWINYPIHWIAPVNNDLPLRFFDSLISGGIPLVPSGLKPYLNILGIPENFYICYTPFDLIQVKDFVASAVYRFEKLGEVGRMERHVLSLESFHVDEIIYKLIFCTKNEFSSSHKMLFN